MNPIGKRRCDCDRKELSVKVFNQEPTAHHGDDELHPWIDKYPCRKPPHAEANER